MFGPDGKGDATIVGRIQNAAVPAVRRGGFAGDPTS